MRKISPIFILLVAMFTASCASDSPSLNTNYLYMEFEDDARLRIDDLEFEDVVRWRSSNEFVASVDRSGVVRANHVGDAYISAFIGNEELVCQVVVEPIVDIFQEPILAFGESKRYIYNEEWRELIEETRDYLWFEDSDVDFYKYMFEFNKLIQAGVTIKPRSVTVDELNLFLDERYQFVLDDMGFMVFERDYFGVEVYADRVGVRIIYYELATRSARSRSVIPQSELNTEAVEIIKSLGAKISQKHKI